MIDQKESVGIVRLRPANPVVVVVDDEPSILSSIRRVLRNGGYQLLLTQDPAQALDWVRKQEVNLIISDQRMPAMSGTELLDRVRRESPRTSRIVLTGQPGGTIIIKGFIAGVDRMMNKPWDDDNLRAIVRQLIRENEMEPLRERFGDRA